MVEVFYCLAVKNLEAIGIDDTVKGHSVKGQMNMSIRTIRSNRSETQRSNRSNKSNRLDVEVEQVGQVG